MRGGRRTFRDDREVVAAVAEARNVVAHTHAAHELRLEQVAFVEEEDELRAREELACADGLPEEVAVLETIYTTVLGELLVKTRYGRPGCA